ncbi:MAG TPA: WD40 repeat domain-containing serine/threonine protein kinase [Ktedonobacteraceae bacterium]|nr:WD40 repeat domain-containing serine/threonine protein kinase [Ktedonobacteraceae bacterium]
MTDRKYLIDGRYEQRHKLGEGGMGVVYLAYDILTQQLVALKAMTGHPEDLQQDQKAREKFKSEIQIAKELDHQHVLRALDSGEVMVNGRRVPYLISEYIPEGSLQDLISKKHIFPWEQWTLSQTADAIMQAAQGLWYLHNRIPIIAHRDVKPGNVLYRTKQSRERAVHLYLCDFGLARRQKTEADLTSDLRGTFLYMAPEQAVGGINYLADQYALAVMACYLLTGHYPISGPDNMALLLAHKAERPRLPSSLNPSRVKPGKVDQVILKALAKEPQQRFPSVIEFARELQHALQEQERGYSGATMERTEPDNNGSMFTQPSLPHFQPKLESVPIILDHSKLYQQEDLDQAAAGNLSQRKGVPLAKSNSESLPYFQFRQLLSQELPSRPNILCWSWDGNYVMCLFNNHVPLLVDRKKNMWSLPTLGIGHTGCWTPEKHIFVISSKNKMGSEKYSRIAICNIGINSEWAPTFPPFKVPAIDALDVSCRRWLALWVDSQILIFQLPVWSSSMQIPSVSYNLVLRDMFCDSMSGLRWSPDGSMLAIGARNGAVICWNVDKQKIQWSEPASHQRIYSLAWSPDSTSLAIAFSDKRVVVWNVLEQRQRTVWERLSATPHVLSISQQQQLTVASSKPHLLFGKLDDAFPFARYPGSRFVAWSPTRSELATLDPEDDATLVIWQQ